MGSRGNKATYGEQQMLLIAFAMGSLGILNTSSDPFLSLKPFFLSAAVC